MKSTLLLLSTFSLPLFANAQAASIQSQRCLGGSGYDYIYALSAVPGGGMISAGYTESADHDVSASHGNGDCWVVRYNANGNILWSKTYGGSGYDYAYATEVTTDGHIIVAGYTESSDGDISGQHGAGDMLLLYLDPQGNIEWQKCYGGSGTDNAFSIAVDAAGNCWLTGSSNSNDGDISFNNGQSDAAVVKCDAAGNLLWMKCFGGSSADYFQDLFIDTDGTCVLAGFTASADGDVSGSAGAGDAWLMRTGTNGDLLWQRCFGGSGFDHAQSIVRVSGGFAVAGYTESQDGDITGYHDNGDSWIARFTSAGNVDWEKTTGGSGNDYAYHLQALTDGTLLTAGYAASTDGDVSVLYGDYDCWINRFDMSGGLLSEQSFGGSAVDIAYSVLVTTAGDVWLAGYSMSADGQISGNYGNGDGLLLNISGMNASVAEHETPQPVMLAATDVIRIYNNERGGLLQLYDLHGKLVSEKNVAANGDAMTLVQVSDGIYVCRFADTKGLVVVKKLWLSKN